MRKIFCLLMTILFSFSLKPTAIFAQDESEASEIEELEDYSIMYGAQDSLDPTEPLLSGGNSSSKEFTYIAILIEFPDLQDITLCDADTLEAANSVLNGGSITTNKNVLNNYEKVTSLKEWLERYSYHTVSSHATIFPRDETGAILSYTATYPSTHYLKYSETNPDGYLPENQKTIENELLLEALTYVKPQIEQYFPDPSSLDQNGDGIIDALNFFVETNPNSTDIPEWCDLLWSHKSELLFDFEIQGVRAFNYNFIDCKDPKQSSGLFSHVLENDQLILNESNYAVIIHEFLHTLGLPDLYRQTTGYPVDSYDIMASDAAPYQILSFQARDKLNWGSSIPIIKTNSTITISKPTYTDPNEIVSYKLQSPLKDDEYFIVEYYDRSENLLFSGMYTGFLVYRVDTNIDTNLGQPNGRDHIYVLRSDDTFPNAGNGITGFAVMEPTINKTFGKTLEETNHTWASDTLYYNNGENSGIKLEVIESTDSTITFQVSFPKIDGSGTEEDPFLISNTDDWYKYINNNAYVRLENDLDFSGLELLPQSLRNLHLDGNGKTISNINIKESGIFSNLISSSIKNLTVQNISIQAEDENVTSLGTITSCATGSTFENIVVESGSIKALENTHYVGGILGDAFACTVSNCVSHVDITNGYYSGGFAGHAMVTSFDSCISTGAIHTTSEYKGGFIGALVESYEDISQVSSTFENCIYDIQASQVNQATSTPLEVDIVGYKVEESLLIDGSKSKTQPLTLTMIPEAKQPSIAFCSLNEEIATLDSSNCLVMAKANGTTEIETHISVGSHELVLKTKVEVKNLKEEPSLPKKDKNSKGSKTGVANHMKQYAFAACISILIFTVVILLKRKHK